MSVPFSSGSSAQSGESPAPIIVRAARRDDERLLAPLLARAFERDPQLSWLLGPSDDGRRRLERFFALQLRDAARYGAVDVAVEDGSGGAIGAALWMPPGRRYPTVLRQLATIPTYARIFGSRLNAAQRALAATAKVHPTEPHWYLTVLGVEPREQGRGAGAALVRAGLARAGADGVPAYLETNSEKNVAIYEHLGFEVRDHVEIPGGCPPSTTMWHPGPTGAAAPEARGRAGQ
jgi:ribosomal protein S18 acetylase RimI-like enzyme